MSFYSTHRFGDFVEIILGGTPRTSNPNYWGGDIPWASVVDFTDNKKIYTTEKTITIEGLNNSNTKLLNQGDIILSARGTVGKLVVCGIPMAFNQSCYALRTKDTDFIIQDFLYYYTKFIVSELQQKAVGGVFDTIIKSTIENVNLFLPDIHTQHKIASILSAYDDLIENNLKQIKLLEEAAQLIYKEWFVNFKFPGYENTKFVNGLPEGWGKIQLKEIGKIITGKTPDTNNEDYFGGDVPFIRIPDMHNKVYIINTSVTLSEKGLSIQSNNTLPPNTILVSCIGSVGIVALTSCYSQTNQQINAIIPFQKEYVYFLYFYMKSIKLKLEGLGSNGATMHNVNKNKFSNILLIIPKVNTIHMFYELVINNFNKIFLLEKQVIKLMQARDLLLPKLMSGEIEV